MQDFNLSIGYAQQSTRTVYSPCQLTGTTHWPGDSTDPRSQLIDCPTGYVCFEFRGRVAQDTVECCVLLYDRDGGYLPNFSYSSPALIEFTEGEDLVKAAQFDLGFYRECRFEVWISSPGGDHREPPGAATIWVTVFV